MAYSFVSIGDELRRFTASVVPEEVESELARFAKSELSRVIASGKASPVYSRFVNGIEGLPEEAVEMPNGILYVFSTWETLIDEALADLHRRAPRKLGRFAEAFIVIVNGRLVTDFESIPVRAEVWITNAEPYVRRLETRKTKGKLIDRVRRSMGAKHGERYEFETRYLSLSTGIDPRIPYILRQGRSRRKDRQAGQAITYPAIVITRRGF